MIKTLESLYTLGFEALLIFGIGRLYFGKWRCIDPLWVRILYTYHCVAKNNRPENKEKQVLCCNTLSGFDFCSLHGFNHSDESTVLIAS